jgi:hypothetical protein
MVQKEIYKEAKGTQALGFGLFPVLIASSCNQTAEDQLFCYYSTSHLF